MDRIYTTICVLLVCVFLVGASSLHGPALYLGSTIIYGGKMDASSSGGYNASVEVTAGANGSIIEWFHGSSVAFCGDLYWNISTTERCTNPDDNSAAPTAIVGRISSFDTSYSAKSSAETCFTLARLDVDEYPMLIKGGSDQHGRGPLPLLIPPGSFFHMECFAGNSVMLFAIQVRDL